MPLVVGVELENPVVDHALHVLGRARYGRAGDEGHRRRRQVELRRKGDPQEIAFELTILHIKVWPRIDLGANP